MFILTAPCAGFSVAQGAVIVLAGGRGRAGCSGFVDRSRSTTLTKTVTKTCTPHKICLPLPNKNKNTHIMAQTNPPVHRPRAYWHDYAKRGIYLITIVVRNREKIFGELNMDKSNPAVILSDTGKAVAQCWRDIPSYQAKFNRSIQVLNYCVMPDHFHGIIFVKEDTFGSLGEIIQKFKSKCTQAWRKCVCGESNLGQPTSTDYITYTDPITHQTSRKLFKNLSKKQRENYFATQPRILQPLFEDNYDDSILRHRGQLQNMINYVKDNPRRAIYMKLMPQLFGKYLCIEIAGTKYAAFGNLFLLKAPHKIAVMFHRKDRQTGAPYETTEAFQKERAELLDAAADGSVIVTAGISKGEQIIKNDCFENGFSIIHIQKEPINQFWKPEQSRFEVCIKGKLLIISPMDLQGDGDYGKFHYMNELADKIADYYGDMRLAA